MTEVHILTLQALKIDKLLAKHFYSVSEIRASPLWAFCVGGNNSDKNAIYRWWQPIDVF